MFFRNKKEDEKETNTLDKMLLNGVTVCDLSAQELLDLYRSESITSPLFRIVYGEIYRRISGI